MQARSGLEVMEIKNCKTCGAGLYIWWHRYDEVYVAECGSDCYTKFKSPSLHNAIQLWNEAQEEWKDGNGTDAD